MGDWKERSNKRRDFRNDKSEIVVHTKAKKANKKPYKIEFLSFFSKEWMTWRRYRSLNEAKMAREQLRVNRGVTTILDLEMRIVTPEGEIIEDK